MPPPTPTQRLAVLLAFLVAALSLTAVLIAYVRTGQVPLTPLAGGLLMLVLALTGLGRLRSTGRQE